MTTLTQLIEHYCPDGVEYVKLGDVASNLDRLRKPVTAKDRIPGPYPYYGANGIQDWVDDYLFEGDFVLLGEDGSVIHEDGTPFVHWATGKIWVNNHAHILTVLDAQLSLRFLFHALKNTDVSNFVTGGTQLKINQKNLNRIPIPLPPREVQDAIVERLDVFATLIESLDSEIVLREKRFEYFREQLLEETQTMGDQVLIGDLAEIHNSLRRPITKKNRLPGATPYYGASGIVDYVEGYTHEGDYLLVSEDGANLQVRSTPVAFSISGQNWVNNHAHVLSFDSRHLQRYVEHYFACLDITEFLGLAAQPKLTLGSLKRIPIAVPPDSDVREIADKLDTIQSLIDNLKQERELRKTQFEYYREKLLTFNS